MIKNTSGSYIIILRTIQKTRSKDHAKGRDFKAFNTTSQPICNKLSATCGSGRVAISVSVENNLKCWKSEGCDFGVKVTVLGVRNATERQDCNKERENMATIEEFDKEEPTK